MGILKTVTRTGGGGGDNPAGGGKTYNGGHSINIDTVMAATDAGAINPMQPGNFQSIRTNKVVQKPQYYSKEQAEQLTTQAKEKLEGARHTRKAYTALKRVEQADLQVHGAHRGYQAVVSEVELQKKRIDAKLAKQLHAQRPQYTQLGVGIQKAEDTANKRIVELTAKIKESV